MNVSDKELVSTLRTKRAQLVEQLAALDLLLETYSQPVPATQSPVAPVVNKAVRARKSSASRHVPMKWGGTAQYVSFITKEISASGGQPVFLDTLAGRYWTVNLAHEHGNGKPIRERFKAAFKAAVVLYVKSWRPMNGPRLELSRKEGQRKVILEVLSS